MEKKMVKSNTIQEEIKRYVEMEEIDLTKKGGKDNKEDVINNILIWWKENEKKFPHLAELAKKYLCIGATSVSCERVFSRAGWIVSKRRSCLSDKNVSTLTFISQNIHYLD